MPDIDTRALNLYEVAETLHASYSSVLKMVHDKRLPSFKVGQQYRIYRRDLLVWLSTSTYDRQAKQSEDFLQGLINKKAN